MATENRRRGARRPIDVPSDVLRSLEEGAESANHMEQIALDMGTLLSKAIPTLAHRANDLRNVGLVTRMRRGGQLLYEEFGLSEGTRWSSDTLRGWAAMAVGAAPRLTLGERLRLIEPYADDVHFAVREWAWLSLRPHVTANLPGAISALGDWVGRDSAFDRRFAVEVTRPRGVWSRHIEELKRRPELGEPLLEAVRADPSRYVQDSVSNWINDASKTSPEWASAICARWTIAQNPSTDRICRRALRSLNRSR
jgi:3-methyladenine DNA glycosylase AlkC